MITYFEETPAGRREVTREHVEKVLCAMRRWSTDREKAPTLTLVTLEARGSLVVNKYRAYHAERTPDGGGSAS